MKEFWVPVVLKVCGVSESHAEQNAVHDLDKLVADADNAVSGFRLLETRPAL